MSAYAVTVTGDSILNRRVCDVSEPRFLSLVSVIQKADVGITHLETLIHDYDGPEVYPAAEAGWTWMRSPRSITEDLAWLGVDMVSLASNHAFDYSVGGLRSTWRALGDANILHAGTGEELSTARSPAFLWRRGRKIALLSAATSVPRSARAGAAGPDVKGRPGVNPLGFSYAVDAATWASIRAAYTSLGRWVQEIRDGEWLVHDPGLHNSGTSYIVYDEPFEARMVVDPLDEEGNLSAIADAAARSDITVVHLHNHEWDPARGLSYPPQFVVDFAHKCVQAGAAIVVAEGSHAPLRGVEMLDTGVIIYDPGELFRQSRDVTKLPYDFYRRYARDLGVPIQQASTSAVFAARSAASGGSGVVSPPGGYRTGRVEGGVVVEVTFNEQNALEEVRLHPFDRVTRQGEHRDLPRLATGQQATEVLQYINELSEPFETRVRVVDDVGIVTRY